MAYAADTPARTIVRPESKFFYFYLSIACVAVAFLGFAPTYWVPIATHSFKANPVVHIHGMLFFAWTLYLVYQSWLVAAGRVAKHRTVGLIGVSLATAMTIFGYLVAIASVRNASAAGLAPQAIGFMIVPVTGITFFAVTVIAALVKIKQPQAHKRLMILATVAILPAAIARWFLTFLAPPGAFPTPGVDLAPSALSGLILVAGIVHDWRTRGKPHAVYVVGGSLFVVVHLLEAPVSQTAVWQSVAGWMTSLPG
ncbi:MAG: hypothetical protein JWP16_2355 [Alphaproteobacteria bacterium]|nr:hypothetical protein [Alphaproteobacteria bacterium]MDB5741315.1 hypothetical protein [Alphaproteobacteria bacterium]